VRLKNKNIWCVVMMILIVAFDQITKYLAKSQLLYSQPVTFIKGVVEFRYAENTGVAFSAFSGGRWFFVALTVVVAVGLLVYMFKGKAQQNLWLFWTLGVIVSGAIGNLIDRVFLGYVIDFINPTFVDFAVFNIADCAVTLGTISLIAYLIFDMFKKEPKNE
jgi:signal peptidase II